MLTLRSVRCDCDVIQRSLYMLTLRSVRCDYDVIQRS